MRTIRFMLAIAIACSLVSCYAQSSKKVEDKEFQTFLEKFRTIKPPLNYKKTGTWGQDMTEEEAIKFLHKTKTDIYVELTEIGENDVIDTYIEKNLPGYKFKYALNDSLYILCIVESILGISNNTIFAFLYSFTHKGEIIDKNLVYKIYGIDDNLVSFVLLDKTHIRVFYYEKNYERQEEGFLSTVYYVNYEITGDGRFIEKDKSDIIWLKNRMIQYSDFDPKMPDDPMGEYDF